MQLRCGRRRRLDREESHFAYGAGIDFSKMMKTCTCPEATVAVLIRIGRQPFADSAASAVSIAGAASLMIWYSCVLSIYVSHRSTARLLVAAFLFQLDLETADCGRLCIVDIEYRKQPRHLHDIVEFFPQIAETHGGALSFRADMRSDQCAQARAVDIFNVSHVQNDLLLTCGDEALQFLTERVALFSPHNATIELHHRHAIYFAVGHSYGHARTSAARQERCRTATKVEHTGEGRYVQKSTVLQSARLRRCASIFDQRACRKLVLNVRVMRQHTTYLAFGRSPDIAQVAALTGQSDFAAIELCPSQKYCEPDSLLLTL